MRLEWEDINWEDDYIEIAATKAQKALRDRFVPLNDTLKAWILLYRRKSGYVCRWKRPNEMLTHELARMRKEKKLNLNLWPADVLRHSYGSYHIKIIRNRQELAEEMGNSPEVIAKNYRRPVSDAQAKKWFDILPPEELMAKIVSVAA